MLERRASLRKAIDALHAVADWIKSYVVKPHKELGRAGPVCPFVPGALERRTFWLALEQIADRDGPAVVELMDGYRRLFLDTRPTDGDDAKYKVIVVVFTDLPADRAPGVFDSVLEQLAVPSYAEDGEPEGGFEPPTCRLRASSIMCLLVVCGAVWDLFVRLWPAVRAGL